MRGERREEERKVREGEKGVKERLLVITNSREGNKALDYHFGCWGEPSCSLEQGVETDGNGACSCHCCNVALHKPPGGHRL